MEIVAERFDENAVINVGWQDTGSARFLMRTPEQPGDVAPPQPEKQYYKATVASP
jgi:hypothetical protein